MNLDASRIEYMTDTGRDEFAAKNAAFCEGLNMGKKFALFLTTSVSHGSEEELQLDGQALWYGLVVTADAVMPFPLFCQAAGMDFYGLPTSVEEFMSTMSARFMEFNGISWTPYVRTEDRRETLETARQMASSNDIDLERFRGNPFVILNN